MSKRVFIVGGGESLKGFDFNRLAGEDVIAINLAYQFIKPKILLWMDRSFYENHKEGIDQLNCIKYAPDNVIATDWTEDIRAFRTGYQFKGKEGFTKGIYAGNPASTLSGLASISLAFALDYEEVFLLGFDGSQKHFHNGYEVEKDISHKNIRYRDIRGLKIYNCSLNSKIDAFPKISIDDALSGNLPEVPTKQDVFLEGYAGAGDNIWQRPFIKEYAKKVKNFYLMTYFPFFYWDIPNIKFVKPPHLKFKSAIKSMNRGDYKWVDKPRVNEISKPSYWAGFKAGKSIATQFEQSWDIKGKDFTMPVKPEWESDAKKIIKGFKTKKKICVIHFPTKRKEWQCPARDPKPEYLQMIIDKYKDKYYFVSLADIPNEEFYVTPRGVDKAFHHGELTLEQILGLVKLSDLVITGNCYLLPFALVMGAKIFSLWGGCQKPELFLSGWDLSNTTVVHPEPFCNCLNPSHDCNKEIPKEKIISAFENQGKKKALKKILFYKIGPRYHKPIRDNKSLQSYQVEIINKEIDIKQYVKDNHVDLIITTHYPPEDIKKLGIDYLFCEAFLDGDKVFDRKGYHYTPKNEIKKYVDKVRIKDIDIPKKSKIEQPVEVSKDEFFKKYNLNKNDKYIVILGQELGDKSLIHSHSKTIKTYYDYIGQLATENPEVKFIFKPHPVYSTIKKNLAGDMDFIDKYSNIIKVNESIHSLFNIFDKFTAFSSTTIFEGLLKDKKFATIGYHFCDDPKIVLRPRELKGLYRKLARFKIDRMTRTKYLNFILNYYRIDLGSPKLLNRIEKTSDEYFKNNK